MALELDEEIERNRLQDVIAELTIERDRLQAKVVEFAGFVNRWAERAEKAEKALKTIRDLAEEARKACR